MASASPSPDNSPPPKFCSSPWTEGVLRILGTFLPSCKTLYDFGQWKEGLDDA